MIATNTIAPISYSLKMLVQRIREEVRMRAEFGNERDPQRADQDVIASVESLLNRADRELAALSEAESALQANGDLSDEGRRKAMVKAVAQTYEALKLVRREATTKRAAAQDAQSALTAVPKGEQDPILDTLLSIEVRADLRKLAQADRMKLVTEAVQQQKSLLIRAVMNDPFHFTDIMEPLVPRDYLSRIRDEHAQTTQAKAWRRLETLVFSAEKLEILAGAIEANLGSYGQPVSFPAKPVRESDLGQQNSQSPPPKGLADEPPSGTPQFQ